MRSQGRILSDVRTQRESLWESLWEVVDSISYLFCGAIARHLMVGTGLLLSSRTSS